jgi:chorismate mutase
MTSTHSITEQMRKVVREALEQLLSEDDFWDVFDEVIEAEVAKAYCSLSFGSGKVWIYLGEGTAPEKDWGIDEIKLWADYDDFIPHGEQIEEAEAELASIDAFMARLTALRAKIADNIARGKDKL